MLDLENIYKYHSPKEGQNIKYETLRAKGKELAEMIMAYCPVTREQMTALTKVEEAVMWANAGIARNT